MSSPRALFPRAALAEHDRADALAARGRRGKLGRSRRHGRREKKREEASARGEDRLRAEDDVLPAEPRVITAAQSAQIGGWSGWLGRLDRDEAVRKAIGRLSDHALDVERMKTVIPPVEAMVRISGRRRSQRDKGDDPQRERELSHHKHPSTCRWDDSQSRRRRLMDLLFRA